MNRKIRRYKNNRDLEKNGHSSGVPENEFEKSPFDIIKEKLKKLKEAENKASFIDEKIGNEIKEMPSNQFYNIIRNYL